MAGYPPRAQPKTDYALAEQQGQGVSGVDLQVDLANLAESVNQLIGFIKALATSNRRWQPSSAKAQDLVEQHTETATAGQTDFLFPAGVTARPTVDKARVFSGGVLIDPALVTLAVDRVTVPAQTVGTLVVTELYNDAQSLRTDLEATSAGLGASLVGLEDVLTFYAADNLEDALAEIGTQLEALKKQIIEQVAILADGSVAFTGNQSLGGHRITNAADGQDSQDLATMAQLQQISEIYGDLGNVFLALTGGTMGGPISMGSNRIHTLAVGTQPGDAVRLSQLTQALTDIGNTYLAIAGGTMTGALNMGGNALTGLPSGDQGASSAMRRDAILAAISGEGTEGVTIGGISDTIVTAPPGCPPSSVDFPDLRFSGMYDFAVPEGGALMWPEGYQDNLAPELIIRVDGDLDLSGRTLEIGAVDGIRSGAGGTGGVPARSGLFMDVLTPEDNDFVQDTEDGNSGAGGAAGAGASGEGVSASGKTPGLLLAADPNPSDSADEAAAYVKHAWKAPRLYRGGTGRGVSAVHGTSGGRFPAPERDQPGGGALRLLVNGNINMEGCSIQANGRDGNNPDEKNGTNEGFDASGAGSVVVVCTGTITCGEGAEIQAQGARGGITSDEEHGSSGGGYIAVVCEKVTGTLLLDATGGDVRGGNIRGKESRVGNGGLVEVSQSAADGSAAITADVSKGDDEGQTPDTPAYDGFFFQYTHKGSALPYFGAQ